eukprot:10214091-Alexandrium_andersonii.AAC.1
MCIRDSSWARAVQAPSARSKCESVVMAFRATRQSPSRICYYLEVNAGRSVAAREALAAPGPARLFSHQAGAPSSTRARG